MKFYKIAAISAGLIAVIGAIAIPLINNETRGEDIVNDKVNIPPIDTARPAVIKTATFAMG